MLPAIVEGLRVLLLNLPAAGASMVVQNAQANELSTRQFVLLALRFVLGDLPYLKYT